VTGSQDPLASHYLPVQVAVRELVARTSVEEVLAGQAGVGAELSGAVQGVDEVSALPSAAGAVGHLRASDLKRAQAQMLPGRAEGLAALARARGGTAALRKRATARPRRHPLASRHGLVGRDRSRTNRLICVRPS
jgi:hypothetical protein